MPWHSRKMRRAAGPWKKPRTYQERDALLRWQHYWDRLISARQHFHTQIIESKLASSCLMIIWNHCWWIQFSAVQQRRKAMAKKGSSLDIVPYKVLQVWRVCQCVVCICCNNVWWVDLKLVKVLAHVIHTVESCTFRTSLILFWLTSVCREQLSNNICHRCNSSISI